MATVTASVWEGQPAWVKTYPAHARRTVRRWAFNALVRVLGVPALASPPRGSWAQTRQREAVRLMTLTAQGVPVPHILSATPSQLVLSDGGPTLRQSLRGLSSADQDQRLGQASHALAQAHAAGAYLGQPFARNVTWRDGHGVMFLDLEDDPLLCMDLTHAQVRDGLLWAYSVARATDASVERTQQALLPWVHAASGAVRERLAQHLRALAWLPTWGREGRWVATAVRGLQSALRARAA